MNYNFEITFLGIFFDRHVSNRLYILYCLTLNTDGINLSSCFWIWACPMCPRARSIALGDGGTQKLPPNILHNFYTTFVCDNFIKINIQTFSIIMTVSICCLIDLYPTICIRGSLYSWVGMMKCSGTCFVFTDMSSYRKYYSVFRIIGKICIPSY